MLKNCNFMRKVILSLILVTGLGISTVTRAQDEFEAMTSMVNLMDSFFDLMDSFYEMSADDEKALLLQMNGIEENYKEQGRHGEAVEMYRRVLRTSSNPTVRNMAYQRMADVLKESGDLNGANGVLNEAMEETLNRLK